jgi:hypothetical protein
MKHLSSTSWLLSILVLLCGCGGGGITSDSNSRPSARPIMGPTSDPAPRVLSSVSNWQFSATSTVSGMPSLTIAGGITQSGSSVSGTVHVDGSSCFDRLTAMRLTGTVTGDNISLTSTPVAGQVTTFTGSITDNALTGTFSPGLFHRDFFTGTIHRDVYHKRWLCQRRPGERHRHQDRLYR